MIKRYKKIGNTSKHTFFLKKNNNHSKLGKKHMEVCDWIKKRQRNLALGNLRLSDIYIALGWVSIKIEGELIWYDLVKKLG